MDNASSFIKHLCIFFVSNLERNLRELWYKKLIDVKDFNDIKMADDVIDGVIIIKRPGLNSRSLM